MKLKNFFLTALAAAFAFASCELIDPETTPETPDQEQTPGDTEKPGDTENPDDTEVPGVTYTSIAKFNAAEVSEDVFYTVKGTIVNVEEISASFQNATLTIADESGAQLYIFRMKPAGEDKIEELGLTLGDVLVVKGNRGEYNGKIQMVNSVYVSHEDKEAPAVVVTEIGLAAFNALEDSNADLYRISGTIKEISAINTDFQNVNVTIVDEAGDEVYIYRLKVADESDKTLEQLALKVGDVLTVVGNKGSYNGDPQMVNGKYESHVVGESPEIPEDPEEPKVERVLASSLPWAIDEAKKSYTHKANINGEGEVEVLKLGTSSAVGEATITVPAGASKLSYWGVAWSGKSGEATFAYDGASVTQAFAANPGASGNSPYTMTLAESDFYEITFSPALAAETTIKITSVTGKNRVILGGFVAE